MAPGGLPVPFEVKTPFSRLDDIAVAEDGTVTTLAGSQTAGYMPGKAIGSKFDCPTDMVIAKDGRIFVSDTHNHRIRLIQP